MGGKCKGKKEERSRERKENSRWIHTTDAGLTGSYFIFFLIDTVQIFWVLYNIKTLLIVSWRSCFLITLGRRFSFKIGKICFSSPFRVYSTHKSSFIPESSGDGRVVLLCSAGPKLTSRCCSFKSPLFLFLQDFLRASAKSQS